MAQCLVTTFAAAAAIGVSGVAAAAAADEPARTGLLLEYRFEGDLADSSGAAHHGRLAALPVFAAGQAGQCLSLDGTGSFLDSGTNLPTLTDTFTIECWVKPAATQRPYADVLGNHHNDFAGFALQQDGELANRYYFTYGTGSGWIYTRTLGLTPNAWQHIAIVKTPDRLRLYLNGMLTDSQPAERPMKPSPTPFMVGLGIASQARWFNGDVDEVRVWDRARTFKPLLPEAEQIELFVQTGQIDVTSSARWRLFPCQAGGTFSFAIDPERVPPSVEQLAIAFDCRDAGGRKVPFAPTLELHRDAGFRGSIEVPAQPGYRRLASQPTITHAGQTRELPGSTLTFLVHEPTPAGVVAGAPAAPSLLPPAKDWLTPAVLSLDGEWHLATDPQNCGVEQKWWQGPPAEAVPTRVPWIIQDAFPGYHGVAWYWRDVTVPTNPHAAGRTLLRFWAVDYKADVWLNDLPVGSHEGGEAPFVLDVTDTVRAGAANRLAVRVLNPTHQPIDGMTLNQTPRRAKVIPYSAGASYNHGGIVDSVELLALPATYIEDLYLRPDPTTGALRVELNLRRVAPGAARVRLDLAVAPAAGGATLDTTSIEQDVTVGDTLIQADLHLAQPRRWELNDPYLYRVTARLAEADSRSCDERSDRCGFRDARFVDGAFRLNGKRLFLRSAHTVNAVPVGQQIPADPDLFRRDLLYMKVMGFNCIRFIWGGASRAQLDLCDELGLLVYAETAAANPMADSPQMPERFDRSVAELIRRDRNHPSIVIWGLLNETFDGPVFRHATQMLPLLRSLDPTCVVALNSGRWDGCLDIGSFSNPGATGWDTYLGAEAPDGPRSHMAAPGGYCVHMGDVHAYPRVPHTAETMRFLRTLGQDTGPVLLSEYGIGSAVDLWRVTRHFERLGKETAEDAQFYRERLDRFLADWERWRLAECFAGPDEFFSESLRKMADQRTLGLNAIRANPAIIGHNVTGMMDHVNCGEGLFTLFRELKPGTVDALFEAFAPLRLCLFAEPATVTRGETVHLDAVLANEDALPPGDYPVRLQVVGPGFERLLERTVTVTVPARTADAEAPLALPFFAEDLTIDAPRGRYRFLATLERGGAATGGAAEFYADDLTTLPPLETEVVLWGDDPDLARWLAERGIRARPFVADPPAASRQVILVGATAAPGGAAAWRSLAERLVRGDTALFLSPGVFREGDNPVAWLPLAHKGAITPIYGWLYLKDEWTKAHPIFAGLPAGGLMDYTFYREIIPDLVFAGQDPPAEAVAGAIKASQDYASGLLLSVNTLGAGRFILNTLLIRENLGRHPVAERLLRNLIAYAARDVGKPLAALPPDLEAQLTTLGYR